MHHDARSGVTIVGSANMDLVFTVARIPRPGETLLAESAERYPGGKGLNQAVAAARAGAQTTFIGALGSDENGDDLLQTMADASLRSDLVRRGDAATGQAFIVVDAGGENTIIVASGANGSVAALTADDEVALAETSILLMQLELPIGAVIAAAESARRAGATVMLNAAPAGPLPTELISALDYLIVNEHEARIIGDSDSLETASATLSRQVDHLIVTLGSKGSVLYEGGAEIARVDAIPVTAVDTTGAGDTFCGAFAAAIEGGRTFIDAAAFASAAAALSVQSIGAVPSVPFREAIDELVRSR
jgi:ribokinase